MRIAIFGTCQVHGVATLLARRLSQKCSVEAIELVEIESSETLNTTLARLETYDLVVSHPLIGPRFGPLEINNLRKKINRLLEIPSIVFTGFHPDICYIKTEAGSLKSVLGENHSALIAGAFLAGLPEKAVPRLFNKYMYSRLGYLDEFRVSSLKLDWMLAYFAIEAIDTASTLLSKGVFMHTSNHPSALILDIVARHISLALASEVRSGDLGEMPVDVLAAKVIWPIYPEIANTLGVEGSLIFSPYQGTQYSLDEFINAEYAAFKDGSQYVAMNPHAREVAVILRETRDRFRPKNNTEELENVEALVAACYRVILEREPDLVGFQDYVSRVLEQGQIRSYEWLLAGFIDGSEGRERLGKRIITE